MAVTALCSQDDVEFVWSTYGVSVRVEDGDGGGTAARIAAMLEKATVDVQYFLLQRYPLSSLQDNAWVKWAVAIFAAVDLGRRRGNPCPEPLLVEWRTYHDQLVEIRAGKAHLPSDTGRAAPMFDNAPLVSNLRVDSRYRQPIRRLVQTSTFSPQAPSRKNSQTSTVPPYIFW